MLSASDALISCILNFRLAVEVAIIHMVGLMMQRKLSVRITVVDQVMREVVVADIKYVLVHFVISHVWLLPINKLGKPAGQV